MSLTIERLGLHGEGVATGPVYVSRALPGEEVQGEILDGRMPAPRILKSSDQRVAAPCGHYKTCGGCQLQHASDEFVAEWKVGVVREALAAHGLQMPFRALHTSPPHSRRRATFTGRRTKSGVVVGFHGRRSDTISDVGQCTVLVPGIVTALPVLQELTRLAGSRRGTMRFAVTSSDEGLDLDVDGGRAFAEISEHALEVVRRANIVRLSWHGDLVLQYAPPLQTFAGVKVVPPAGAFLQASKEGEAALSAGAVEAMGDAKNIIDLFAGCGTLTFPLSRHASVTAIEGDREMVETLDAAWRGSQGTKRVTTLRRDLFRDPVLASELNGFDGVVIDPPRAGAKPQFSQIAESLIGRVASVSCNPVTFARDTAILAKAGFKLDWVDVVDQFRWSPHVEVIAQLSR